MTLHSLVKHGLTARLHLRRALPLAEPSDAVSTSRTLEASGMRVLEMGLSLIAIATALLIGLGR